ncbi:hypothetical protein SpCBS45565_g07025 [Spizellomyces sp. 'palustris']|nr:hypothetical protein SpCBS45565_g07025 [Spizellomyces sp. 'palustris']
MYKERADVNYLGSSSPKASIVFTTNPAKSKKLDTAVRTTRTDTPQSANATLKTKCTADVHNMSQCRHGDVFNREGQTVKNEIAVPEQSGYFCMAATNVFKVVQIHARPPCAADLVELAIMASESKVETQADEVEGLETIVTPGAANATRSDISNAQNGVASSSSGSAAVPDAVLQKQMEEIMRKVAKVDLIRNLATNDQRTRRNPKDMDQYKFWKTQPVPRVDEKIEQNGPIEPDMKREELRQEPYPLPKEFEWSLIDIEDEAQIKELYQLLSLNYVEDDDAMFRFDYSAEFLKWALKPPGWKQVWHIGVRVASNKKLVAFISGVPADLRITAHKQKLVEINFLCVHKKLRAKRLAPVLIKEVTRRVNLEGIFQATYTAGVYLPTPVTTCRYYHRSLNPKKLIETGFSHLGRNMTMARTIRLYKLPETTSTPGLRPMAPEDVAPVTSLLNQYMRRFPMSPTFSEDDVRHWLLPIDKVLYSYVALNPKTQKISDFFSFYSLPSTVIGHPVHKHINAAYLFYYAPKGLGEDVKHLQVLLKDALILARKAGFDVFNCLDLMQNGNFLEELKFGRGDGNLHYYLYNYRCQPLKPEEMGLVLL